MSGDDCPQKTPNDLAFERGYDQAVREVMEEVWRRDPMLAAELVEKYPVWAEIIAGCNGQ